MKHCGNCNFTREYLASLSYVFQSTGQDTPQFEPAIVPVGTPSELVYIALINVITLPHVPQIILHHVFTPCCIIRRHPLRHQ